MRASATPSFGKTNSKPLPPSAFQTFLDQDGNKLRLLSAGPGLILQLTEIAALRTRLVPEWPIYGVVADGGGPKALAGRIDAIAYDGGRAEVVIDWKSDVDPNEADMRFRAAQLEDYRRRSRRPWCT
jgi:hypothetical protein